MSKPDYLNNMQVNFLCTSKRSLDEISIPNNTVLFHGDALDTRGELALKIDSNANIQKIFIKYDFNEMILTVAADTVNADDAYILLSPIIKNKNVILEATTLGFAELFCVVQCLISLKTESLKIIYTEPESYVPPEQDGSNRLSELIPGFHPIPHAVIDLTSQEVEAGVFFLGYESERIERALEDFQMIASKQIKLVFGLPAFKPGWELNAIVPHLSILKAHSAFEVAYCCASDPGSAFDALEKTRKSLSLGHKMFVSPIGPKPCGVASAIFASLYPEQVGLLFDHPKRKPKRTDGANVWHEYLIHLTY